jgi:hypothetical protein
MTLEELNVIVPETEREAVTALIEQIKAERPNPFTDITDEAFTEQLKGNVSLQKVLDARVTKGIETWKKNNEKDQEKFYQERYAKEHPEETEAEKRIKALEISAAESERRAEIANMKSDAITALTTAKVEGAADLASLLFDNGKEPMEKVEFLSNYVNSLVESITKATTEKILKENGRVLDEHDREEGKYYTNEQIAAMSDRELSENQEKVLESMTYNQTH